MKAALPKVIQCTSFKIRLNIHFLVQDPHYFNHFKNVYSQIPSKSLIADLLIRYLIRLICAYGVRLLDVLWDRNPQLIRTVLPPPELFLVL